MPKNRLSQTITTSWYCIVSYSVSSIVNCKLFSTIKTIMCELSFKMARGTSGGNSGVSEDPSIAHYDIVLPYCNSVKAGVKHRFPPNFF